MDAWGTAAVSSAGRNRCGGERNRAQNSRVVLVDVDVVQRGLLQAEDVDHGAVQDVVGLSEELIEAPTLLLIRLQDVGQNRGQETLEAPGGSRTRLLDENPDRSNTL